MQFRRVGREKKIVDRAFAEQRLRPPEQVEFRALDVRMQKLDPAQRVSQREGIDRDDRCAVLALAVSGPDEGGGEVSVKIRSSRSFPGRPRDFPAPAQ